MVSSLLIGGKPSIEIINTFSGEIFHVDQLTAKLVISDAIRQGHELFVSRKEISHE